MRIHLGVELGERDQAVVVRVDEEELCVGVGEGHEPAHDEVALLRRAELRKDRPLRAVEPLQRGVGLLVRLLAPVGNLLGGVIVAAAAVR